jgi:hypothetical protein
VIRKPLLSLTAGLVLWAASGVAQTAVADPAPTPQEVCTHADLSVSPVSIAQRRTFVRTSLATDCFDHDTWAFDAVWSGVSSGEVAQATDHWTAKSSEPAIWDDPPAEVMDTDHLGTWTWRPVSGYHSVAGAREYTLTTAKMNSPTMDVRVVSSGTATAVRRQRKITVTTTARRYWTSIHAISTWSGAAGVIQYRSPASTTWTNLKSISSDQRGRCSWTYRTPAQRSYRVVLFNAPYIWGSASRATATR